MNTDAAEAVRAVLDKAGVDPCAVIAEAVIEGALEADVLTALDVDGLDEEVAEALERAVLNAGG